MLQIYIVSHKPFIVPTIPYSNPIYVGTVSKNPPQKLAIVDSTGENITEKNPVYNELTAHYWIWKNTDLDDYIGLCHYRRFFNFNSRVNNVPRIGKKRYSKFNNRKFGWSESEMESFVKKADIIVAREENRCSPESDSIYDNMLKHDPKMTLLEIRRIVEKLYPEYLETFDAHIKKKKIHSFNMFVMKKELFEEYSEFLFKILFEFEEKWEAKYGRDNINRTCGFMGEHLLHVFAEYKKKQGYSVIDAQTVMYYSTSPLPTKKEKTLATLNSILSFFAPYGSKRRDRILYKFFYNW